MKKYIILLLSLCWSLCISQAQETIPTLRILPEDVLKETIKQEVSWGVFNEVSWTYTEAGAKKLADFAREHLGQKMCYQIGSFKQTIADPDKIPERAEALANLKQWEDHQRIVFIQCKSEEEARGIVASLKAK